MIDIREMIAFDAALAVGDAVEVRWTNSGLSYREPGRIVKLNACSARVAIDNDVLGHWSRHDAEKVLYPAGFEVSVPRCTFRSIERWSWNNGVFPSTARHPAVKPSVGAPQSWKAAGRGHDGVDEHEVG